MANKMVKRGNEDNIATYQHVCDTHADMKNIPANQINLGSTCIVLKGAAGIEVYMAASDGEWIEISSSSSSESDDEDGSSDIVGTRTVDNMTLKE